MVANLTTRLGQLTSTPAGGPYVGKNRIINGNMSVDQRNAGASVAAFGGYTLDRWTSTGNGAAMTGTVQQNAGSVTPPVGFTYYLGFTSTSTHTMAAGDFTRLIQPIEGLNCTDLNWGTASARSITISFYLYSSITGSHGCCVQNNAGNRSYPFTVSIPVANTWTYCTATIPGDTTGTWLTTNGVGLYLQLSQGCGTTYSGTANAWAAANYISATGAVNVCATNGATYYVTGVQLEAGTIATPYEFNQYQAQLLQCERYYRVFFTGSTVSDIAYVAMVHGSQSASLGLTFNPPMRSSPTATYSALSDFALLNTTFSQGFTVTAMTFQARAGYSGVDFTAITGGLSAGNATILSPNNSTARLNFSAEL